MAYRINNKLTFIHIPKNAGTSISQWIEQNTNYQYDGERHQHITALPSDWQNNTFCVVRNPYRRAVSWYYFVQQMLRKKNTKGNIDFIQPQLDILAKGFEQFVSVYYNYVFSKSKFRTASHIMTLKNISHNNFIGNDYKGLILKYENIHNDWKIIQDIVGCNISLPYKNTTVYENKFNWKKIYNENSYMAVKKLFQEDIELFGYSF